MKKLMFFIMGIVLPVLFVHAQKFTHETLSIGDTIPTTLLNDIFSQSKSGTIAQNKDKLIVLYFWATWCGSCLKKFPTLNSLQEKYDETLLIIPVTSESSVEVNKFFRSKQTAYPELKIITADTILSNTFHHLYLPHTVWVYEGKVKAITSSEYITSEYISQIRNSHTVDWPVKNDAINFTTEEPLIGFSNSTTNKKAEILHYTAITKYIEGVEPVINTHRDTIKKTIRYSMINMPILGLYHVAYKPLGVKFLDNPDKRILHVRDTLKYMYQQSAKITKQSWKINNTYCYESVWPLSTSYKTICKQMRMDLDEHFKLKTGIKETIRAVSTSRVFELTELQNHHL